MSDARLDPDDLEGLDYRRLIELYVATFGEGPPMEQLADPEAAIRGALLRGSPIGDDEVF